MFIYNCSDIVVIVNNNLTILFLMYYLGVSMKLTIDINTEDRLYKIEQSVLTQFAVAAADAARDHPITTAVRDFLQEKISDGLFERLIVSLKEDMFDFDRRDPGDLLYRINAMHRDLCTAMFVAAGCDFKAVCNYVSKKYGCEYFSDSPEVVVNLVLFSRIRNPRSDEYNHYYSRTAKVVEGALHGTNFAY